MNFFSSLQTPLVFNGSRIVRQAMASVSGKWRKHAHSDDGPAPSRDKADADPDNSAAPSSDAIIGDLADTGIPLLDARPLMTGLQTAVTGLVEIWADTETDFLDLGGQLNDIFGQARQLTDNVVAMLAADQNLNIRDALKNIKTHAMEANRELNLRRNTLANDLRGLGAIKTDLDHLINHNRNFRQVAKNLKMVGLNLSIESARCDESRAHFQALAEEIIHLAQTVNRVAGNISDDTETARDSIHKIQSEIGQRMVQLDGLIRKAEEAVNRALQDVDSLLELTLSVLDIIGTKAEEISEQVGQLVMSIQIHDNISQRMTHIQSAIDEAVELIRTSTMIDLPPSALKPVFGKVYGITRLQIAQVHVIIEDVVAVRDKCTDALEKLQLAVKEVAQPEGFSLAPETFNFAPDRSELAGEGEPAAFDADTCRHPVMILKDAMTKLLSLFDKGLNDIQLLSDARQKTSHTIAQMDTHIDRVREINFDIHLKALNAVVKSTRLGSTGKSIEVLVMEMKELAERSNATIEAAAGIMEKISSASDQMDEKDRRLEAGMATADEQLRSGIVDFSDSCNTFKQQSLQAVEKGQDLQQKVLQARQNLGFFDGFLSVKQHHLKDLKQIGDRLQIFAVDVAEDWKEEEKKIRQRYTMQREREAHSQIHGDHFADPHAAQIAQPKTVANRPESGVSKELGEQEFDDNVELF